MRSIEHEVTAAITLNHSCVLEGKLLRHGRQHKQPRLSRHTPRLSSILQGLQSARHSATEAVSQDLGSEVREESTVEITAETIIEFKKDRLKVLESGLYYMVLEVWLHGARRCL